MYSLLAQFHYGFMGIHGLFGLVLGFILWMIVLWGLWSVFDILASKFGRPETAWLFQIVKIVLIVIISIAFINAMFNLFPF